MPEYQLLPPLSEEEYNALKEDIAKRGVLVPVEYDEDGNILDGHHRVKACEELGIKNWPSIVRIGMSEDEKAEHVLKLNIARRHLPKEWKQEKAKELRKQGWSYRRIGEALGINQTTVMRWLEETGVAFATPETTIIVTGADGKQYPAIKTKPEPKPYVIVDKQKDVERVVKAIDTVEDTIPAKRIELRRLEQIARESKKEITNESDIHVDVNADIKLHRCDFRELNIEYKSVDLIFTDPPYPKEYLPLWGDLGKFAADVLKPGSLLITYVPHYWLIEIIEQLRTHLKYVWIGALYQPGAHNHVHPYHIRVMSKPLLFFSSGDYIPKNWFEDAVFSESRQKELHEWQQSLGPALHFIGRITSPGQLVVDPFLGSGTTALAAKKLGRRFIGCDIDANAVNTAIQRMANIND